MPSGKPPIASDDEEEDGDAGGGKTAAPPGKKRRLDEGNLVEAILSRDDEDGSLSDQDE